MVSKVCRQRPGTKEFATKEKLEIVLSAPVQGEAGGRGVWGEFRPPYKFWAKSVRIFSNAHRQLGNVFVGSSSARARQPFFGEISSPSVQTVAKIAKALSVPMEDLEK